MSRRLWLAVVPVLALAAPARAAERFGSPVTVDRAGCAGGLGTPAAAAIAGGGARVAFVDGCARGRVALWRPGAPAATVAAGHDPQYPVLLLDRSGTGVVAWPQTAHYDLRVRRVGRRGPRGAVRAIETVAINLQAVGPASLAWTNADPGSALRVARVDGDRLVAVRGFDAPALDGQTAVAAEPGGALLAARVGAGRAGGPDIEVAEAPPGGTFGAAQIVSLDHGLARDPVLAVGRGGAALAAWRQSAGGTWRLAVAERARGADAFGPTRLLTPATVRIDAVHVAATATGRFVLAWQERPRPGLDSRTQSGVVRAAFADGPARTVSSRPGRVVALGADARGAATLLWQDPPAAARALRSAVLDAAGRVRAVQRLSARGERPASAALSVAPDGGAVAAWVTHDGRRLRVARRR